MDFGMTFIGLLSQGKCIKHFSDFTFHICVNKMTVKERIYSFLI